MDEGSTAAPAGLRFRIAGRSDAAAIAALHADSWRRHYRGAYPDAFLDGDVHADRLAVWTEQLRTPDSRRHTVVAEDGSDLIGFAHTIFEDDPTWGALLDNLHVAHGQKRRGVGGQLMRLTARAVIEREQASTCGCSTRTSMGRGSTRRSAQNAWNKHPSRLPGEWRAGSGARR